MNTTLEPRTVESFEDLLNATGAPLMEYEERSSFLSKVLTVLLWIPVLVAVALVVIAACFLIWWSIYGDDVIKGSLTLLALLLSGFGPSTGNFQ
ncbi:membrane protein [Microbacterium phage Schubert]|uniref:Membrane protein n=1 Tax=Microbacterium phage Schubert TaxID=2500787 RepID=A0A3Q9RAS4_9CAUD|nr:membrane protein [Microbacterium phage Schubert]AZV01737.1 membrane protein [Microbacterium phage Schubert]